MFSPNYPPYPPFETIGLLAIGLLLFGIIYNWAYYRLSIPSWAGVVGGVAGTCIAMYAALWSYQMRGEQWLLMMFVAFSCSGTPMVVGYVSRNREDKKAATHKRHLITGAAARVRDEAVMDLTVLAEKLDNADHVRTIYRLIGSLKSL